MSRHKSKTSTKIELRLIFPSGKHCLHYFAYLPVGGDGAWVVTGGGGAWVVTGAGGGEAWVVIGGGGEAWVVTDGGGAWVGGKVTPPSSLKAYSEYR